MKSDMAGAAAVIGAMRAIARLKPKVNVLGVIACVENLLSAHSYRPGDVLTTHSGKTIEVLNTDAEGRVILSDAVAYAVEQGANRLVDAATLTGAAIVALGHTSRPPSSAGRRMGGPGARRGEGGGRQDVAAADLRRVPGAAQEPGRRRREQRRPRRRHHHRRALHRLVRRGERPLGPPRHRRHRRDEQGAAVGDKGPLGTPLRTFVELALMEEEK